LARPRSSTLSAFGGRGYQKQSVNFGLDNLAMTCLDVLNGSQNMKLHGPQIHLFSEEVAENDGT